MARFWMCHWQHRYWRNDVNPEGERIWLAGSNNFRGRGVTRGDVVYIVSLADGHLLLGGRMTVEEIVSREEAIRRVGDDNLYEAREWVIGDKAAGTPLNLHRRLAPALSRQLRFIAPGSEPKPFVFDTPTHLNVQTTRGLRELTPAAAERLDRILARTDSRPRSGPWLTVTEDLLREEREPDTDEAFRLPEEVPSGATYPEGSVRRVLVNRDERDPRARQACIRHYGTACVVCTIAFGAAYGPLMAGLIHVHHLVWLSSVGPDYEVDPIRDLRPICPNCHAVAHRREPPYTLDEVRQFLHTARGRS